MSGGWGDGRQIVLWVNSLTPWQFFALLMALTVFGISGLYFVLR